ncbi:hypothetical protein ACTMU2_07525 [Cupriavidus basilensis]
MTRIPRALAAAVLALCALQVHAAPASPARAKRRRHPDRTTRGRRRRLGEARRPVRMDSPRQARRAQPAHHQGWQARVRALRRRPFARLQP